MFTGIIKGQGVVQAITDRQQLRSIQVLLPTDSNEGLELGASIAIDGVCLTVTSIIDSAVTFDIMSESLKRTTLGSLIQGSKVNIERAAKDGAEIGGHPISGHVDCMCEIISIDTPENNLVMTLKVPAPFIRYVFSKGYIALNGTSLTVSGVDKQNSTFQVWFIPETLRRTTFGTKRVGDWINLEIERGTQVTVDTVREFLEERLGKMLPKLQALLGEG